MTSKTVAGAESLVRRPDELQHVVAGVRAAGRFGLDTEFMREKTYRARLCLVQVATPDHISLIDPLGSLELAPLADLIGDLGIEVVLHAGKQDLEIFYDGFGVVPRNVFDVQVAAGFAGHGASLAYGRLVEKTLGVALEKGESYTDWCRRPLTKAQVRYAADDVRYLLGMADLLKRELETQGRLAWAQQELASLEEPSAYQLDLQEIWRKVSGRGGLSGRQVGVLRELAQWREEAARARDIPRGWVIKDPTLIEIARRLPTSLSELSQVRGLNQREVERAGRDILSAITRGLSNGPVHAARSPSRAAQARARMLSGLGDALVRARCDAAGVAPELVATRGELEDLLVAVVSGSVDESEHRILQGWRRSLAGDAVIALARGEVAVRATDHPPYVEEVPL